MGQFQQQLDELAIPTRLRLVAIDRAAQRYYPAGQALAHLELLTNAGDQLTLVDRLYSLFVSTSFNIRCSKDSSAYIAFSRRFSSSSNSRNRRMLAASMPPYFVFHL
jgi:hypothetical protein